MLNACQFQCWCEPLDNARLRKQPSFFTTSNLANLLFKTDEGRTCKRLSKLLQEFSLTSQEVTLVGVKRNVNRQNITVVVKYKLLSEWDVIWN